MMMRLVKFGKWEKYTFTYDFSSSEAYVVERFAYTEKDR